MALSLSFSRLDASSLNASSMAFQNMSSPYAPAALLDEALPWNNGSVVITALEPRSDAWTLLLTAKASIEAVADPLLRPVVALGQQLGRISDALFAGIGPQLCSAAPQGPAQDLREAADQRRKRAAEEIQIECAKVEVLGKREKLKLHAAPCPEGLGGNIRKQLIRAMEQDAYTERMVLDNLQNLQRLIVDVPRAPGDSIPPLFDHGMAIESAAGWELILSPSFNGRSERGRIIHEFWHIWEMRHPELQKSGEYRSENIANCLLHITQAFQPFLYRLASGHDIELDRERFKQFLALPAVSVDCPAEKHAKETLEMPFQDINGKPAQAALEVRYIYGAHECRTEPVAINRQGEGPRKLDKFEKEIVRALARLGEYPKADEIRGLRDQDGSPVYQGEALRDEMHARFQEIIPRQLARDLCPELGIRSDLSPGPAPRTPAARPRPKQEL